MAVRVYYKLLTIPGYKAYEMYHSQLFALTLMCFSIPKTLCDNENKFRNRRDLKEQVNFAIGKLKDISEDLKHIIGTLKLGPDDMNFEDILANLLEVTGGTALDRFTIGKIFVHKLYITPFRQYSQTHK